jgi:hypothetical protein
MAALRSELFGETAAARRRAEEDNQALRGQVASLHRQFAETLAKLVDEQIASTVEARLAPVEARLREEMRREADRFAGAAASAVEERLSGRLEPVHQEVATLQERVVENDRNTLELVLAMGQLCLQTAERLSPPSFTETASTFSAPAAAAGPERLTAVPATTTGLPAAATPCPVQTETPPPFSAPVAAAAPERLTAVPATTAGLPAAATPRPVQAETAPLVAECQPTVLSPAEATPAEPPQSLWRIPLVSSFFAAAAGLLLLHYL